MDSTLLGITATTIPSDSTILGAIHMDKDSIIFGEILTHMVMGSIILGETDIGEIDIIALVAEIGVGIIQMVM
jgi:hypothetical protein